MVVVVYLQLQSLLRSRLPESEIEIELERTWRHLELTWRWSGPEFDNLYINILTFLLKKQENFHFCFEYVKICCNCAVAVLVQEYATIIIVQII